MLLLLFLMSYKTVFIKEKIALKQLCSTIFLKDVTYLFYFWPQWVFTASGRLFLGAASRGYFLLWCWGFSLLWLLLMRNSGSRRMISIVVAHSLGCSEPCGIFQGQESNPCPLHWQAGSLPLDHQRSPLFNYFF